jgi:hypothetical protein
MIADPPTAHRPDGDTLFIADRWRDAATSYKRFDRSLLERPTGRFASASDADVQTASGPLQGIKAFARIDR